MLQFVTVMSVAIGLLSVSTATIVAEDRFMVIHMDNQKIGSAVANHWAGIVRGKAATPATDGFMAIHLDNQKIGSELWRYWQSPAATASK